MREEMIDCRPDLVVIIVTAKAVSLTLLAAFPQFPFFFEFLIPEPQCMSVRIPKLADYRSSSLPVLYIQVNRLLPFLFAVHSRSLR